MFCYRNNLNLGGVERSENTRSSIPDERLGPLVNEIVNAGIRGVELTGQYGEPTLHPMFNIFVNALNLKGIKVGLITNGDMLDKIANPRYFSYVRVSMSSLDQVKHESIRRGKRPVTEILDNIRGISYIDKGPVVGIGLTIDERNYTEVYDICKKAYNLGCDNIRLTQVWKDDPAYWQEIRDDVYTQVTKAREEFSGKEFVIIGPEEYEKVYLGKKKYKTCYYSHLVMNITSDGKCWPCCVKRNVAGFDFGNINYQTLDEVIWGYARRDLLKSIDVGKCPACIWDAKNEFLEYCTEGGDHEEFV
jgi:MoaA/NifB/PqqE/SkfB family radical SAM enzyme